MSKRFNGSFKGVDKVSNIEDISSMANGVFDLKAQYTFSLPPEIIVPWLYGGTTNGYMINSGYSTPTRYLYIDKFSFASETDQTNVGSANTSVDYAFTASSDVAGYAIGGDRITSPPYYSRFIYKMPFASQGLATYTGDLDLEVGRGASAANQDYALAMLGGTFPPSGVPSAASRQTSSVQRMPFASDTDGAITTGYIFGLQGNAGYSTQDYGWTAGGYYSAPPTGTSSVTDTIRKWPFAATPGTAEDVGDLTTTRSSGNPLQSDTHAYYLDDSPTIAEKFPFAVPVTSALLSELDISSVPSSRGTTTSTTTGYLARGETEFHKLNYASDTSLVQITGGSPWSYYITAGGTGFKV